MKEWIRGVLDEVLCCSQDTGVPAQTCDSRRFTVFLPCFFLSDRGCDRVTQAFLL